ncbi:hypothetical protein WJX77_009804 [Trebouxia sp. C0004]
MDAHNCSDPQQERGSPPSVTRRRAVWHFSGSFPGEGTTLWWDWSKQPKPRTQVWTQQEPFTSAETNGFSLACCGCLFGAKENASASQTAMLDMIRGFGLPFSKSKITDKFALSASAEDIAQWLQAPEFETIMSSLAQPLTNPLSG